MGGLDGPKASHPMPLGQSGPPITHASWHRLFLLSPLLQRILYRTTALVTTNLALILLRPQTYGFYVEMLLRQGLLQ